MFLFVFSSFLDANECLSMQMQCKYACAQVTRMSKFFQEILVAFRQRFRASEILGDGGRAMLKLVHSNPKLPQVRGLNF